MLDYALFREAMRILLTNRDTYKGGALSVRFEFIDDKAIVAHLNPLGYPDSYNLIYHNDNAL